MALKAEFPCHFLSLDFIHDACLNGSKLKIRSVVDEFTWEFLALEVDVRLKARRVCDLASLVQRRTRAFKFGKASPQGRGSSLEFQSAYALPPSSVDLWLGPFAPQGEVPPKGTLRAWLVGNHPAFWMRGLSSLVLETRQPLRVVLVLACLGRMDSTRSAERADMV